ncbi:MutS domain V protein [Opisthorchis viverrini]|uniref:MutS domain V protein n=1 Tax=Opisthorchis viverrini TaxID=6198 RepID=A0A1S8X135_OPIVI|nr:MutS domain V protein [Opisthorchis viverrini]
MLVAREYFNNVSLVKHYHTAGHASLAYITIKKSNTDFLRHFLLKRQYRVEIYTAATKSGRDNEWTLKLTASPGNLQQLEDILLESQSAVEFTGITSIFLKWTDDQLVVSLAFCDKESRRFVVGEFVDSIHLANLETALVQLESRECLIPVGLLGASKGASKTKGMDPTVTEHLNMIFQRAGFLATEVEKNNFALQDVTQDLNYLLRRPKGIQTTGISQDNKALEHKQGLACLGAIIKYLDSLRTFQLKADDSNAGVFSLEPFSLDNFVRLDSAATRALHLLPGPDDKNRYQSVYGVLNNCRTQQGQRLLAQWLRQPLTDVNKINERLDMVEAMVEETGVRQSLHDDFLRRMPDFQRIGRKLQRKQGCGLQASRLKPTLCQGVDNAPNSSCDGQTVDDLFWWVFSPDEGNIFSVHLEIHIPGTLLAFSSELFLVDMKHRRFMNTGTDCGPLHVVPVSDWETVTEDVYRIYQAIARLQNAISLLRQCGGQTSLAVQNYLIEPLQVAVENFSKFQEMVQSTIDLEMIQRRNEYIIRSDFDDELGELKSKLDKLEESIEDEFRGFTPYTGLLETLLTTFIPNSVICVQSARKLNLEPGKSVKLDSNEQLGYFMRVTLKEEKTLREFKSFEVLDAQKGGVRFRNSTMSQLNSSHLEMKQEYAAAQQTIVDEVIRITAGYLEPIHELNACTALLDVIVSLAVTACSATGGQYVRPRLLPRESGRMVFKEMRHPCLELQDTGSVIPNDVHLERGKQIFLVITGPNMGGKSTYIRSVGVITAMAQIGSFVPCSFAELFPVDAVMARVGAADCQIRGVSTFMAEMLETSSVLRAATPNSLVIIDELGRGTSTFDGFGLAWAVASHLAGPQLGCLSLFATHFHELTILAHHMPGRVSNLRVTAHVSPGGSADSINGSGVVMLYKVEPGICTRSYGLDVAKLVGLPDKVLTEAEHKAARDEQLESLWLTLDGKYRMDSDGDPASKRIRWDSDVSEAHASAAVVIADQLRGQLLRILDDATGNGQNATPDDVNKFGAHLAQITKALLNNSDSNLPQELLLLAK